MTDNMKEKEDADKNTQFREYADTFIDVANKHMDNSDGSFISSSMLYGTSRFCAFVVASTCKNAEELEEQREGAVEFFSREFTRMLSENLGEYKEVYKNPPRYEHLVKKK